MTSARAYLTAVIFFCGLTGWASPAQAQDGYDASTGVQGVCVSNCGTSGDSGYHTDLTFQDLFRRFLPSNPRGSQANASNHEAIVAQRAGNLDEALRLFRRAHAQDRNDLVIRSNLMSVLVQVAWRDWLNRRDAASVSAVERLLDEMDGLRNPNIATQVSYYGEIVDAGARVRAEIDNWRQAQVRAVQNARALDDASHRIASITGGVASDLNRQSNAAANSNLGFGDPSAVAGLRDGPNNPAQQTASLAVNTDASVVDLRDASTTPSLMVSLPPSLPRLQEVENSPGRETWAQGMYAVINHDWNRAAEFFARAHAQDPDNEAITNALALAEWTRDRTRLNSGGNYGQLREPTPADRDALDAEINEFIERGLREGEQEHRAQFNYRLERKRFWDAQMERMLDDMMEDLTLRERARQLDSDRLRREMDQEMETLLLGPERVRLPAPVLDRMLVSLAPIYDLATAPPEARPASGAAAAGGRAAAASLAGEALRLLQSRDLEGAIYYLDSASRFAPEVSSYGEAREFLNRMREIYSAPIVPDGEVHN